LTVIGGGTTQTISYPNGTATPIAFTGKNSVLFSIYPFYSIILNMEAFACSIYK
jgi:hypothetical protein